LRRTKNRAYEHVIPIRVFALTISLFRENAADKEKSVGVGVLRREMTRDCAECIRLNAPRKASPLLNPELPHPLIGGFSPGTEFGTGKRRLTAEIGLA
jgi:hypothetical protein